MPSPRAVTATMAAVRETADRALARADGLIVRFFVEKYGSMVACHEAARSFQTTFSALRARERRLKQKRVYESSKIIDTTIQGPYDAISCNKRTMEDNRGVMIIMARQATIAFDLDVVDLTTGQPLEDFSEHNKRLQEIFALFFAMERKCREQRCEFTDPLNNDERRWFFENENQLANEFYTNVGLDVAELGMEVPSVDWRTSNDPNDIPLDVDPFTGEKIV